MTDVIFISVNTPYLNCRETGTETLSGGMRLETGADINDGTPLNISFSSLSNTLNDGTVVVLNGRSSGHLKIQPNGEAVLTSSSSNLQNQFTFGNNNLPGRRPGTYNTSFNVTATIASAQVETRFNLTTVDESGATVNAASHPSVVAAGQRRTGAVLLTLLGSPARILNTLQSNGTLVQWDVQGDGQLRGPVAAERGAVLTAGRPPRLALARPRRPLIQGGKVLFFCADF